MRYLKTTATALIVGLVLLMATDYVAMAATGKPLILGKVNKAGKTTTVKTTTGPALKLSTTSGEPPLQVNRTTKVTNLNADLVDGKSASSLGVRTRVYGAHIDLSNSSGFALRTPPIPQGYYLITLSGFLTVPTGNYIECTAGFESASDYFIDQYLPGNNQGIASLNAAGVATVSSTQPVYVECFTPGNGTIATSAAAPLRISLTSIDSRVGGSMSAADGPT